MSSYYMKNLERLVYDVGMHEGEDTAFYLEKGFRVVAFEANPELVAKCSEKFHRSIQEGQLRIVSGAIVRKSHIDKGEVTFFKNEDRSVWGTVEPDWNLRNNRLGSSSTKISVPTVDIWSSFETYGIPYYLKIDIEGVDTVCLEALKDFDTRPAYISIESEKVHWQQLLHEFELFADLGYNKFKLVNQALVHRQQVPNPTMEGKDISYQFPRGSSGMFGKDLGNEWISERAAVNQYRAIFLGYRVFGDQSKLRNTRYGKWTARKLSKLLGTQVPGWYDTHAQHSSLG